VSRRKRHFERVFVAEPNPAPPRVAHWLRFVQWTAIVAAAMLLPTALALQFSRHELLSGISFFLGMGCAVLTITAYELRTGEAPSNWGYFTRTGRPFGFWLSVCIWGPFTVICFGGAVSLALGWSTPPDRDQRSQQRSCAGTPQE
jgi:dolichyl-phosphate-mannose--protein O-mannosyl transferase